MYAESAIKGSVFWVVDLQKKTCDMSILEEAIPRYFGCVCHVYKGGRRLLPPFSLLSICQGHLGYLEDSIGGYICKGGLLVTTTSRIF